MGPEVVYCGISSKISERVRSPKLLTNSIILQIPLEVGCN